MKIRNGFVTNSSSTNFIIISKEELTFEYLFKKLGFTNHSKISSFGSDLAQEVINGSENGLRWFEIEKIDYNAIKDEFGESTARKYEELNKKGYFTYIGHISSDNSCLTSFMTMDRFEIDDKDFYMNGLNCAW